ncbi:hypothetical protein DOK76_05240 [Vagococcus sp. DIV0080]|uniref:Uncharacterized protein n=1 Tax=Candidatus Vagococcus giribetii TaxID=2230876 RepID=A0ABS3HSZ8_9ENTE|nr:hypothetical protein [Vagococcus sp. DIV0080]MBO0476465.1 hypothetical protein [Vagococcus sp. DIV0080]
MFFRKKVTRGHLYRSVLFFTIIYFILIYFQKRILTGLFNSQLSFTVPDVLGIVTSDAPLDVLTKRATNGAILTGGFLFVEIILFILLILLFLFKLWRIHQQEKLKKYDFVLLVGLLILLMGSFYYAYILGTTSLETYQTVTSALNHLSPKQLDKLATRWKDFIYNYQFSLGYLPRDISIVIDQFKQIMSNVQEVADIPNVLSQYINRLSELKLHYFLLMCAGFGTLMVAQIFEYRLILTSLKQLKPKNKLFTSHNQVSETQLTQLLEEQQVLMSKIIDLQADLQQTITKESNETNQPKEKSKKNNKKKKK